MTLHKTRNILVKPFSREKLLRSESASGSDEQIQTWPSIVKKVLSEFNNLSTLYNVILRTARNFLETRENVKIWTHPFYHTNLD